MSTVTVFGGTGFLGREVVRAVCDAGFEARSASRRPPAAAESGQVSHVAADVGDEQSVRRAVEGAAAVVNAVSLYVESGDVTFDDVHVEGAARVARCARAAGVRVLVHVSGLGVDPDSPSAFVRARSRGEQAVCAAFDRAVVIRPSVMFGPDGSFLKSIERVTRLPVVPLFGHGETRLQPAFVGDVAAAVARIIESGRRERLYELGGAEVSTYREIVEQVMAHLDRRRLLMPVPFPVWQALAGAMAVLPSPPLTRDQLILMQTDNVVTGHTATFADLAIEPAALPSTLPTLLPRRRR